LKTRAISLFSGGLDSILAVKILQDQQIDVVGLSFETPFFDAGKARAAARAIDLPLVVMNITDEHLAMLRAPRYGYGRNMNPCLDCHALMLKIAGVRLEAMNAAFIATGEVLGQRPMSQNKQSLYVVAKHSGFLPRVLRPLSARLLPETEPEQRGLVDRARLLDIEGRSRKRQMALAEHYGITRYPAPAGGCLLTDPMFSKRLRELFAHRPDASVREIELLKHGRHFRLPGGERVVVGRHQRDNLAIERLQAEEEGDCFLKMDAFPGPSVLIPRGGGEEACRRAAALCVLYGDAPRGVPVRVQCRRGSESGTICVTAADRREAEVWII